MSSSFAVRVERITAVEPHPNADRLDLIQVLDWKCVTAKGTYQPGDLAVYFPIDSLLPADLEAFLFPPDAKVKLNKSRIRTIKLRGAISQGMCISLPAIQDFLTQHRNTTALMKEGFDLQDVLNVTKYEPPEPGSGMNNRGVQTSRKQTNPYFHKYTSIENAKNYPDLFPPGVEVVVTEKIHGTNFRAGYVPFHANTWWKRLKQWFGLTPAFEFVYGSHNVQLQDKLLADDFYTRQGLKNVYAEAVRENNLKNVIPQGRVIYGEIYGDGIQKGYTYGCGPGERGLVLFDIKAVNDEYLDYDDFLQAAQEMGLPTVPVLYRGPFDKEKILSLRDGDSVMAPSQKVREGVVVRPVVEQMTHAGRLILKFISDQYLLKEETNYH